MKDLTPEQQRKNQATLIKERNNRILRSMKIRRAGNQGRPTLKVLPSRPRWDIMVKAQCLHHGWTYQPENCGICNILHKKGAE